MLIDSHIHIGQFNDIYFDPVKVANNLKKLGVKKCLVMSTSTMSTIFDYSRVKQELVLIKQSAPDETILGLWVIPEIVKQGKLKEYLDLDYKIIKIHPYAHRWNVKGRAIRKVFEFAGEKKLPVIIHTGGCTESDAGSFLNICKWFSEIQIVLAHGRPIDQALKVLEKCENTFVDTAFMPLNDIKRLVKCGLEEKIIFGSDYPMDTYFYPNQSAMTRYRNRLERIKNVFNIETIERIFYKNFCKISIGK